MGPVKKRAYESPVRQEQAAQTRARIVQAAGSLFEERGYGRTTIRQVAEAAGVAVDTVYATFGNKGRVLTAVMDDRLAAGTGVANVMDRPEALAIRDEPDQRRQLALLAADLAATITRVGPVFEMLRSAASVDEEMAAVHAEMQGYRRQNFRRALGWIAARGPLRVDLEEATDTLWLLASPDVALLAQRTAGWSTERHAAWLAAILERTLLPDPGS